MNIVDGNEHGSLLPSCLCTEDFAASCLRESGVTGQLMSVTFQNNNSSVGNTTALNIS